ncbi:MAG: AbrB family transcriptional regulator, partial [Betaproteobacteria bacterium]
MSESPPESPAAAAPASLPRLLLTVLAALAGALLAVWVHLPLPWFTGPLLALAAVNIAGAHLPSLPFARDAGQWIIGI